MPGSSLSGWPTPSDSDPIADGAKAVRDLVDGIEAGWTAFTPVWTAATTNPTLGNGSLLGRYKRFGKSILYRVVITIGSTTALGSGQYSVGIPATAHASGRQIVSGELVSGSVWGVRGRIVAGGINAALWTPGTVAGGADRPVTGAVPTGLVAGAEIVLEGVIEAA